ncbi:MAG: YitT family protein [Clostridiales bacterium]|jgi:uncharacterized membrane-anchored protein YitT (DUF2179 family)|nr:YitT family protein [Clostridiales bacterium]
MKITKRTVLDYGLIIAGTTLIAFGINYFYAPNDLITGGVTGLAIIIANYAEKIGVKIPLWLTNLAFKTPLFLLGVKTMGRQFLIRTVFSTLYLSLALYYTAFIPPPVEPDLILASVFGGVISGAGMALVLKAAATTGGSDMAAMIIHRKFRHVSISRLLFIVDGAVIAIGLLAFGPVKTMYAIIAVYITSKVIDGILEGLSFAKAAFIISDASEAIAGVLMAQLERGVTSLNGQGMYTKAAKNVLLCVVSGKETPKLKEMVHAIDENAFVIVADVREVLGEGFKRPDALM